MMNTQLSDSRPLKTSSIESTFQINIENTSLELPKNKHTYALATLHHLKRKMESSSFVIVRVFSYNISINIAY